MLPKTASVVAHVSTTSEHTRIAIAHALVNLTDTESDMWQISSLVVRNGKERGMSLEQEIRDQIENIKKLKLAVGEINNHLSALETLGKDSKENVYQKGYEEGRNVGIKDGMCEAWEAARKIALMDTETSENVTGYFGLFRIMENLTPMQAIEKLKAYEEKQKADDEINVGDEVRSKRGWTAVVVKIDDGGLMLMDSSGAVGSYSDISKFSKTGRHFDIQSILEAMRT